MDTEKHSYSWEKMSGAMHCLAGAGTQKERIMTAILVFHTLKAPNNPSIPPELRSRFDTFWKTVEFAKPGGKEGIWQASVDAMTDEQVRACIEEIIGLYDAVTRYQEPWEN